MSIAVLKSIENISNEVVIMTALKYVRRSSKTKSGKFVAYFSLIFVVFVWGVSPNLYTLWLKHFSASLIPAVIGLSSGIALLIFSAKHLRELNKKYFLLAIPTGIFNGLASILQKIGLQYTTPSQYAFLENLSCVVVPFLMFLFVRKKPNAGKIIACLLCLAGAFVLNFDGGVLSFGIGDILCAMAGILYGVNIALTGAFAKQLNAALYVMIQMFTTSAISFATAFTLNAITVNGAPIEPLRFSFNPLIILLLIAFGLLSNAFCWIVRTNAMKKVDATVVAVIMPFSAVVTAVISVIKGADPLTNNLIIGGFLSLCAAILSGFSDGVTLSKIHHK